MHKIVELEEADKETMHLLVFLFMQFLSRPDQAYPSDDKLLSKTQGLLLRHLYLLLGYNQTEKNFYMTPQKLRLSAVFNVFITNLPQVLDQNHKMGIFMIQPFLAILQNCPCPPQKAILLDNYSPSYSLWYLETHCRRSWLISLLVILYKYEYRQQQWCSMLQVLIRIVLHTLNQQYHKCKRMPATVIMSTVPSRSRDLSQPSLGIEHESISAISDDIDQNSPILPTPSSQRSGGTSLHQTVEMHWEDNKSFQHQLNQFLSYSITADDTESELAAIPESPQSDKTFEDSSNESIQDLKADEATISEDMPVFYLKLNKLENENKKVRKSKFLQPSNGNELKFDLIAEDKTENSSKSIGFIDGYETSDKTKMCSNNTIQKNHRKLALIGHECKNKRTETDKSVNLANPSLDSTTRITDDSSSLSSFDMNIPNSQCLLSKFHIEVPITVPAIERLLPVGSATRTNPELFGQTSTPCSDGHASRSKNTIELGLPLLERLLPVGSVRESISDVMKNDNQVLRIINFADSISSTDKGNIVTDKTEDSSHKQDSTLDSQVLSSTVHENQTSTPRKLTKQIALDSPPILENYTHCPFRDTYVSKGKGNGTSKMDQERRNRLSLSQRQEISDKGLHIQSERNLDTEVDQNQQLVHHSDIVLKQSFSRIGDECNYSRCSECGVVKEEYTDEELGLCVIILGTFIHREPCLAAPLLPEILTTVTNVSLNFLYPWQSGANIYLPGGAVSVAHQFLRCVLHQMAPNGIFIQIFQTSIKGTSCSKFFKSIAQALIDFNELNPIAPLQILIESINTKKSLSTEHLSTILYNTACYLDCLPLEVGLGPGTITWNGLIIQFDGLFRRLILLLPAIDDVTPLIKIMISILRVPGIQQTKGMLDPFSKVLSFTIRNSVISYTSLMELCSLCQRNFTRDRDKNYLSRTIVFELIQAIKFKTMLPDTNFLLLLQFVLQDVGGLLLSVMNTDTVQIHMAPIYNSNASESLRNQIPDIIDFIMDIHTSSKVKSYTVRLQSGFNEDTLSAMLKSGLAQYLALEITKGNSRENRSVIRYLPWLYTAPSTGPQGAREFLECINRIRLLTWLLLGSLTHNITTAKANLIQTHGLPLPVAQPIPQEASCHIADHIQVIFSTFSELYESSVINMTSLFYTFNLCQLWTLYLEEHSKNNSLNSETHNITINILLEFWGKVTPRILQLLSHSKTFAEIVNHYFLNLVESLLDYGCVALNKLIPIWNLILISNDIQLPRHLYYRLQGYRSNSLRDECNSYNNRDNNLHILQWLRRLQFKMGQIELQTSNINQFYSL